MTSSRLFSSLYSRSAELTSLSHGVFQVSNTVWLTCFLAKPDIVELCANRILQTVFSTLPHLSGILAFVQPGVEPFAPVSTMFEQLPHVAESSGADEPVIFACPRNFFVNPLTVRIARIEDHDDLAPIFDTNSEVLTSIYGEFFLAGLIENQDDHSHCLVGDVDGRAVGLMAFTDEIDVELLRNCFDLSLYEGLHKESEGVSSPPTASPAPPPVPAFAPIDPTPAPDAPAEPLEVPPLDLPDPAMQQTVAEPAPVAEEGEAVPEETAPVPIQKGEVPVVEQVPEESNCFSITLFCIDESKSKFDCLVGAFLHLLVYFRL